MNVDKLQQAKDGLFFEPNIKGYKRNDLKWLNSGSTGFKDDKGSFFFEAVKIVNGNVFYNKQYYTVNKDKSINRI